MRHVREVHLYRAGWAMLLVLVAGIVVVLAACDGQPAEVRSASQWAAELDLCDDAVDASGKGDGSTVKCGLVTLQTGDADALAYTAAMLDDDTTYDWCYVLTDEWLLAALSYDAMRSMVAAPITEWAADHGASSYDDDCYQGAY